jgi:hypothetical protein
VAQLPSERVKWAVKPNRDLASVRAQVEFIESLQSSLEKMTKGVFYKRLAYDITIQMSFKKWRKQWQHDLRQLLKSCSAAESADLAIVGHGAACEGACSPQTALRFKHFAKHASTDSLTSV